MSEESFPVAETKTKPSMTSLVAGGVSKMWIATIACLLLAIGLTWYSMGESGIEIVLHFQQGHGLKPGDAVRDRGIDIGTVTSVKLNKDLDGIEVRVELDPAAAGVAREGSRFWIVRPKLDLTGISGLETAVGSKYIAVSPGNTPSPVRKLEFVGLDSPPVDDLQQGGLELILRGDERFGVNPGSPVTWRGMDVGQVLSTALSPDALHVDVRIRINANHRRLVAANSKFWVISGIQFDAGVTGFELSAESLVTIIRGGIAFITPSPIDRRPVEAGQVFKLHEEEDDDWTDQAGPINLLELHPPPTVSLTASWQEKLLGFPRSKQRRAVAVVLGAADQQQLLVPSDFLQSPEDAIEGSFGVTIDGRQATEDNATTLDVSTADGGDLLTRLPFPASRPVGVDTKRFRAPAEIEDCFVVRRQGKAPGSQMIVEAIGRHELSIDGSVWRSTKTGLSRDVWHGAPVLSADDEKIIGVLLIHDGQIAIVPTK